MAKLTSKKAATLIKVLNAQSGVARMSDKDEYKAALAEVKDFMAPGGGITKETYNDNKGNKELLEAARAHLDAAKKRAKGVNAPAKETAAPKKAAKAAPKKEAAAPKEKKLRSPEEEKAAAERLVKFFRVRAGLDPQLSKQEYMKLHMATLKYRDKNGGLTKESYDRFKGFPGVKEAAKADKEAVKNKGKDAPEIQ